MKSEIAKRLYALAKMCSFEFTEYLLELYLQQFEDLDGQLVCKAIENLIVNRKATDKFPSIADIRGLVVPVAQPKQEAVMAANLIIQAVGKFGYMNYEEAKDFVGSLGWRVVEMHGGWSALCSMLNHENTTFYKAQFKELAETLLAKEKAGTLNQAPQLGQGESEKVYKLKEGETQ